tara:strand:+ start:240 stop:407 length:168 start_codon:yes stop_codon:yes gene_type:complete
MDKAQEAVKAVADGVKKVAIGEKKQKVKKEKGGDGGADAGKPDAPKQYIFRKNNS